MEKTKKILKFFIVIFLLTTSSILVSDLATAVLVNASLASVSTNNPTNAYYTTNGAAYTDSGAGNPDFKIRICTDGENIAGNKTTLAYLISPDKTSLFQAKRVGGTVLGANFDTLTSVGGNCYDTSIDYNLYTTDAKYPGKLYAIIDQNLNDVVDSSDRIIFVGTNGYLLGTWYQRTGTSSLQNNYNQITGNITGVGPGANVQVQTGPTTTTTHAQTTSSLVIGICDNADGTLCNGTALVTLGQTRTLFSGVVNPGDSYSTQKYFVINGEGFQFCIGPDLYISVIARNVTQGYPGTKVNITATVTNNNNVDVTQSYNITFYAAGSPVGTNTLTGLAAGASKQTSVVWDSTGQSSGSKSIYATLDDTGIGDCNNANDNSTTTTFNVLTAYFAHVWIDGVYTTTFNDTGRPYNVTVNLNNSDGFNVANATIKIYEENGYSIFAPIQLFNATGIGQTGLKTVSIAELTTDSNGLTSFALIPTGNKLYAPEYSYKNAQSHVGNYAVYLEAFNSSTGNEFPLVSGGSQIDYLSFTIQNTTPREPNSSEMYSLKVFNQDDVKVILNFVYQAFANARKWLTLT